MLLQLQRTLVARAPDLLRIPAKLLPFSIQKPLMSHLLQRVFREALEDGDFEFLEGKYLRIEVADLGLAWYLTCCRGELQILAEAPVTDVSFSGGLNDLVLIAGRKEDPDSFFFQRRLRIEGDTELGLEVKNLLDSLDLEQLPPLLRRGLGDLASFVQGAGVAAGGAGA